MNRMLIVGNGFDLEHGLKTAYWNFREYLEENHLDFLIAFEKMHNFYPVDFGDPYEGKDAQQKWEKDLKNKLCESIEEAIGRELTDEECRKILMHCLGYAPSGRELAEEALNLQLPRRRGL